MVCTPNPPVAVDSGHPAIFNFYNWEQNHQSSGFRRYSQVVILLQSFQDLRPWFFHHETSTRIWWDVSFRSLGALVQLGHSVTTEFLNLHNVSLGYGAPLAYAEVQLSPLPHWVHPYCGISNPPKHHTTTSTMVSSRPTGPRVIPSLVP